MARRTYKANNPGTEDSAVLQAEYNRAYHTYVASQHVSVTSLVMDFEGDKGKLARYLSGLPSEGKLPTKGTDARKAYDNQKRSIDRYIAGETGSGKQARKPSKETLSRLQTLQASMHPPQGMRITIEGYIGYEGGDFRHRTVNISSGSYFINMDAFLSAMQAGDTSTAYGAIFASYAPLLVASADTIDIDFF